MNNKSNKGFKNNTKVVISPQQIGGIITGVKNGSSYSEIAKRYSVSTSRIKRICNSRNVYSNFKEPNQLRETRKTFIRKHENAIFWSTVAILVIITLCLAMVLG